MSDAIRTAEARHRAFALVGRLFVEGLTAQTRPVVAALPQLDGAVASEDPEAWAVEHERVCGREVLLYESVFRSADGLMGGPIAGDVRAAYATAGLKAGRTDVEPDHLGIELAHLAWLCAAERDAWVDGETGAAEQVRGLQRAFLEAHLLAWAPAVLAGLLRTGSRFYGEVARLTAELLGDLAAEHGVEGFAGGAPAGDDLLDDPRTRLKDIAERLLLPADSGWLIGRDAIGRVAAAAGIPAGFGPRAKQLESVIFAAVDHERLPQLLDALAAEVAAWDRTYAELTELGLGEAGWRERLARTSGRIARIGRQSAEVQR